MAFREIHGLWAVYPTAIDGLAVASTELSPFRTAWELA
jgi:hypothetical protein